MNNDTLNALILRHGDNLLRRSGWPDSVGMTPVAPETVPGWQVRPPGCICTRLSLIPGPKPCLTVRVSVYRMPGNG